MMGEVVVGALLYTSLCNTFGWLRYILPMALKLAIVRCGQGLKGNSLIDSPGYLVVGRDDAYR
jgi:hypothetical protein